jgi:hypothetical protein
VARITSRLITWKSELAVYRLSNCMRLLYLLFLLILISATASSSYCKLIFHPPVKVKMETPSSGFMQRFRHFIDITNPISLIYDDNYVKEAQAKLKRKDLSAEERKHLTKVVEAAIHPVSGEIIPRAFRVSAIAPVNIPIVFAMITCPASNVAGTLFLHWLNQSYNTLCNYYNRSGSDQGTEQLLKAYGLAVTSACGFAYGLGRLFTNGPKPIRSLGVLIPCISTAIASSSNLAFTRYDEIVNGVRLTDETGRVSAILDRVPPSNRDSYCANRRKSASRRKQDCTSSRKPRSHDVS